MSSASATGYAGVAGHWDEMALPSGELRPHWRQLMGALQRLGRDEAMRRWRQAERLIRENGVTYNVYGDPLGMDRPWQLDPLPLLLPISEWSAIEAAVAQRATLLDRMLADLYGPQRLLREGQLPAELVFAHNGFLRPCHGIAVPGDLRLHLYAADLARSPDGQWWVLADRTQAPSGAGYALENRVVTTRVLPEVFGGFHVPRLAGWFQTLRDSLAALAAHRSDAPRIVLLTPGPYNSAYFEHSFLAQQMGVELVEGRDLVVSDGYVHMRTTHGLKRVDVIYRRIDDDFLDPLAFRPDSALGVPGLAEVYRNGKVALANAPGTGIADDKAVYAYVPQIIKYYLGEDIILPNVPTFLCSDDKQREHVLANIDKLVVKPTNESGGYGIVLGPKATPEELAAAADRIRANPRNYVAQPMLNLSRVPSLVDDHFEGRHVDLRPYILYGKDIFVLPGGLTRVALKKGSMVVNSSQGGGSKDTWVLGSDVIPTAVDGAAENVVPAPSGPTQRQMQTTS